MNVFLSQSIIKQHCTSCVSECGSIRSHMKVAHWHTIVFVIQHHHWQRKKEQLPLPAAVGYVRRNWNYLSSICWFVWSLVRGNIVIEETRRLSSFLSSLEPLRGRNADRLMGAGEKVESVGVLSIFKVLQSSFIFLVYESIINRIVYAA